MKSKLNFTDVRDAVERYNPGMRHMTWIALFAFTIQPQLFGINYGRSGDGKSRSTSELASLLGLFRPELRDTTGACLSPVVVAPNSCTDRTFFDFLRDHRNKCIIIDDASRLSPQQISLLKEAMGETGEFEYTTSRDAGRNRHTFTGSIIINTNYEKQEEAIATRSYMNFFYFDHETLTERRHLARAYEMDNQWDKDSKIWMDIRCRIIDLIASIAKRKLPELTDDEKRKVYAAVDSVDIDFYSKASMRDDSKAMKIARLFKLFFGEITDEMWGEVSGAVTHYITAGVLDPVGCVIRIVEQYFRKYGSVSIRTFELIEIIRAKYPNHNFKAWLDTAFAKKQLTYGNSKEYIIRPNTSPAIQVPKK